MEKILYRQIEKINDKDVQGFIKTVLDNAPFEFWTDPCSGSGKYHPPEDQGEGGIIRHLVKCSEISFELCNFFNIPERDKDIVIGSSIIHDIKKNGDPWSEKTDYEHGKIAYDWLEQFSLKQPEKEELRNCVRYHMWKWVKPDEELERALNPSLNERIVQLTDYFCSRKCASFLPGFNVPDEVIRNFMK